MSSKRDEVGEQAVEADGRERDRPRTERAQKPRIEPARRNLIVDERCKWRHLGQRQVRIQLANRRPKRGQRVAPAPRPLGPERSSSVDPVCTADTTR